MLPEIKILFHTRKTYDYIDNQYTDVMDRRCNIIFLVVGALSGGFSLELRPGESIEMFSQAGIILLYITSMGLAAVLNLILGRYILTYLFYWIGKLLKGKAEVIDNRIAIAYSQIPYVLLLPFMLSFFFFSQRIIPTPMGWIYQGFAFIIWGWRMKILLQGIRQYNKISFWKALLNISPIVLLGLGYFTVNFQLI